MTSVHERTAESDVQSLSVLGLKAGLMIRVNVTEAVTLIVRVLHVKHFDDLAA